ncbi:MAG: hypothetical protein AB2L24_23645 [Mangrovibacterium sp.]
MIKVLIFMNRLLTISPLLLFAQAESSLWLLVGMILLSGFIMCMQLYLAGKKMKRMI